MRIEKTPAGKKKVGQTRIDAFRFCKALLMGVLWMSCWGLSSWAEPPPPLSPPTERIDTDPRFYEYKIPAGNSFQVLLQGPLSSEANQLGDPVSVLMDHNLYYLDTLMLPKNTRFNGVVSHLEKAKPGMDGILGVHFTEIELVNGETIPISAHIRTGQPDHYWGGKVTPGMVPVKSMQNVWHIGEYARIVYAGPRQMGIATVSEPGDHWILILDSPFVLRQPRDP